MRLARELLTFGCGARCARQGAEPAGEAGSAGESPGVGPANPCGGINALIYRGARAEPGAACGACGSGLLICVSPTQLGCVSERPGTCSDAGPDAAGAAGSAGASEAAGTPRGGSSSGGGSAGAGDLGPCNSGDYTYQSSSAKVGDTCGACGDGVLGCPYYGKTLICAGATAAGYCNDKASAPNYCGGLGPTLWRGQSTTPGLRCGACAGGQLLCATQNVLTCVTQQFTGVDLSCDHPTSADTCAIPVVAYTATPLTPPAPLTEAKPAVSTFQNTGIPVNSIVYNAFDRRLYASVPASYGANGNSVAVVDPTTASAIMFIAVGNEPKSLAISDDGKVMWVVNSGTNSLRRVDLETLTAGTSIELGTVSTIAGQNIAVVPGTHDSVFVIIKDGLIIYDNGVPRANASDARSSLVTATNSASLAFGYNAQDTGYDLATYCVNDNGVFAQHVAEDILSGSPASVIFDSGVVYGATSAYDAAKQQVLGTYSSDAFAVDSANQRLFVIQTFGVATLRALDLKTYAVIAQDMLFPDNKLTVPTLVRWGRYGFAFTSSSYYFGVPLLYVGRSTIVP